MTLRERLMAKWAQASGPEQTSIAPKLQAAPRVRDGYLPLYAYLEHRYASLVVLTFEQIEALLGFALPDAARLEPAWWTDTGGHGAVDGNAWTMARRTATPNFGARNVAFEKIP